MWLVRINATAEEKEKKNVLLLLDVGDLKFLVMMYYLTSYIKVQFVVWYELASLAVEI